MATSHEDSSSSREVEHRPGHRVQVSMRWDLDGESSFTRYACFDPTCDWCVTELTGDWRALGPEDLTNDDKIDAFQPAIFQHVARRAAASKRGDERQTELLFEDL